MRPLVRLGAAVLIVFGGLWAIGQALARRRTVGDATSDEFELAAYFGGAQRTSTAASLRHGVVHAILGGVDLDLREAAPDPDGATLELSALWGGVNVTVPRSWRVVVEDRSILGGFDARTTPPEELPDDAPLLRVRVSARFGGAAIRAADPAGGGDDVHRLRGFAAS
jgi:hypothetical protein